MIMAKTPWLTSLLVCLVLTGCAPTFLTTPEAEETRLFAQGLDQYILSGDLSTLELLARQYPQGEWRSRAEHIIGTDVQLRQQQALLETKEEELDDNQKEKDALVQDILTLEKTLERLKQVLIDMELRPE